MALNYIGPVYAVQVPKNHEDEGHGAMRASMVILKGFGINIHIPFYHFQLHAHILWRGVTVLTLMVLVDSPVSF